MTKTLRDILFRQARLYCGVTREQFEKDRPGLVPQDSVSDAIARANEAEKAAHRARFDCKAHWDRMYASVDLLEVASAIVRPCSDSWYERANLTYRQREAREIVARIERGERFGRRQAGGM